MRSPIEKLFDNRGKREVGMKSPKDSLKVSPERSMRYLRSTSPKIKYGSTTNGENPMDLYRKRKMEMIKKNKRGHSKLTGEANDKNKSRINGTSYEIAKANVVRPSIRRGK